MFITLEGIDGAGKSTQAKLLAAALGGDTLELREPGGTPLGEDLRRILKDGSAELTARAELLLFAAARAELVERVIAPALAAGRDVVCDRFLDSTLAYQGAARGLGGDVVAAVNEIAVAGCRPDRTILLRLDPGRARQRVGERGGSGRGAGEPVADRFEAEGEAFQRRIASAFDRIAAAEPERIRVVDAEGSAEEVHERVLAAVGVDRRGSGPVRPQEPRRG